MIKKSDLEHNLDELLNSLIVIACIELSTIIGAKGYEYVSKLAAKGDTNGVVFGATYTAGLCLLSLAYPVAYLYNQIKDYRANRKV